MKDYVSGVIEHSGKMVILMEIIEQCILLREKILIFRLFVVIMVVCNPTMVCHLVAVVVGLCTDDPDDF